MIIQEIFGVNSHIRAVCDGYAADGYVAVAPALFDRVEPDFQAGYEQADIVRGREIRGKIGWDAMLADLRAAVKVLQGERLRIGEPLVLVSTMAPDQLLTAFTLNEGISRWSYGR